MKCPECTQSLEHVHSDITDKKATYYKAYIDADASLLKLRDDLTVMHDNIVNKGVYPITDFTVAESTLSTKLTEAQANLENLSTDTLVQSQLMQLNNPNAIVSYQEAIGTYNAITAKPIDKTDYTETLKTLNEQSSNMANIISAKANLDMYAKSITENAVIQSEIDIIQTEITTLSTKHQSSYKTYETEINNQAIYHTSIASTKVLMQQVVEYDITKEALEVYRKLISETLPEYLYMNACNIVNRFIAELELPERIQLMLSETSFGSVYLIDRDSNGELIYREVSQASGMEETIVGLALCFAVHHANQYNGCKFIGMDEMTGKLSTGTEIDPTNYLELFATMIRKASEKLQICVVDHRLDRNVYDKVLMLARDQVTNVSTVL
jgi:hypothetical protein